MKKLLSIMLILMLALSMIACQQTATPPADATDDASVDVPEEPTAPAEEPGCGRADGRAPWWKSPLT